LLGYIFYPIIRLAISRKREYLADAGSVLLTQNKESMISALKKISSNPEVQLKNENIASLFIANPLSKISNLFRTHPSIEDRIKALENY
jgi:heat shock protein HtpX